MSDLDLWRQAAEGWTRHAERIATMTADVTAALTTALAETLAPGTGARLIDLACGAGDPAMSLAASLGDGGAVVACDPVETMVAALRDNPAPDPRPLPVCCPAEPLPFRDGVFDGASCRFGAMFFADVPRALSDLRRVLREGSRAVLVVWEAPGHNPYFTVASAALDAELGPPEEAAQGPGVFAWAEPGALAAHLAAAGFTEVREDPVDVAMRLPGVGPDGFFETQAELSGRIGERAALLDEAQRRRVGRVVAEGVDRWNTPTGLALPARVLLVSGRA